MNKMVLPQQGMLLIHTSDVNGFNVMLITNINITGYESYPESIRRFEIK